MAVVCAGTSDLPVAEEAAFALDALGHDAVRATDVGVAGIHRLFDALDDIMTCRAVIVVAGMEGALPSVVAGLVRAPVIAVPTSVGYGAAFEGMAALLGMLTSCAPGIGVVNIDNGFGAAALAHKIVSAKLSARPMRIAYVDMIGGAAGDMLLAAFLDAGLDRDALERALRGVVADGWTLEPRRVIKRGIAATYAGPRRPGRGRRRAAPSPSRRAHHGEHAHDASAARHATERAGGAGRARWPTCWRSSSAAR